MQLLSELGLFDERWYRERNPDVALSGLPALEHYLLLGISLGRAPGPGFDPEGYLAVYPDAAASGMPALQHYLRQGIGELRIPGLVAEPRLAAAKHHLRWLAQHPAPERVARAYPAFDAAREGRFLSAIEAILAAHRASVDAIRASVIMPAFNREGRIGRAIESVIAQGHRNWELLVIDDGSTDGTAAAVAPYLADPRIRLYRQPRTGVGAARNAGLARATGDMVFYLDSDNRWNRRHLQTLLTYLWSTGLESAYSGLAIEDPEGNVEAYRGEHYSADQCLQANYVDLNAYCHSLALWQRAGGFDPSLQRMVDWDLVLRHARTSRPGYAPFVGCRYLNDPADPARISTTKPYAYRRIVQARNDPANPSPGTTPEHVSLRFAVKIPAPANKRREWGDFHYAESLAEALRNAGHVVRIDFLEQWYDHKPQDSDAVIVLRGLSRYAPHPEHVNVLWNISHPDQVSHDEYEQYHLVYVASLSYPALLEQIIRVRPRPLLQCTDPARFSMDATGPVEPAEVLFVGNSRARRRPIVDWALESKLPLRVHGTRWESLIPGHHIAGEHIPNRELAAHYAAAGVVLNDHWQSMADFGFLSNRIFDVLAAGGTLVSDSIPSIRRVFGDTVTEVDSPASLATAVAHLRSRPVNMERRRAASEHVLDTHSFAQRAATILADVRGFLQLNPEIEAAVSPEDPHPRIALLLQTGKRGPTSSGFIRLIAPLTTDLVSSRVRIELLDDIRDPRLAGCAACIVQRVAVPTLAQAQELTATLRQHDIPLYVDTDDAFGELPDTHPEQQLYRTKDDALRFLMTEARQVWFATAPLMSMYPPCCGTVVPNALDPRIWRNYREPARKPPAAGKPLRLIYMGTPTHDEDFSIVLAALDRLWARRPGSFRLTLVRAVRRPPARPWLKRLTPPEEARSYPRFARWLREQGPFDIGLAPLVDNRFNAAKSDIKVLDYCALGLVSVVSDVQAYRDTAPGADFIIRCSNEPAAWMAALERLIDNLDTLPSLADDARHHLWTERPVTAAARLLLGHLGLAEQPGNS